MMNGLMIAGIIGLSVLLGVCIGWVSYRVMHGLNKVGRIVINETNPAEDLFKFIFDEDLPTILDSKELVFSVEKK